MSGCKTCQNFNAFLAKTDAIIPHDILAAILIAGVAIYGLATGKGDWWLWAIALVASVGIAVDLSAHGWDH